MKSILLLCLKLEQEVNIYLLIPKIKTGDKLNHLFDLFLFKLKSSSFLDGERKMIISAKEDQIFKRVSKNVHFKKSASQFFQKRKYAVKRHPQISLWILSLPKTRRFEYIKINSKFISCFHCFFYWCINNDCWSIFSLSISRIRTLFRVYFVTVQIISSHKHSLKVKSTPVLSFISLSERSCEKFGTAKQSHRLDKYNCGSRRRGNEFVKLRLLSTSQYALSYQLSFAEPMWPKRFTLIVFYGLFRWSNDTEEMPPRK